MHNPLPAQQNEPVITRIWQRLAAVRSFRFSATAASGDEGGRHRQGRGEVRVVRNANTLRFFESARMLLDESTTPIQVRNVYRWQLGDDCIALAHERRGSDAAVALLDLIAEDGDNLASRNAHQCGPDTYRARVLLTESGLRLHWYIHGPKKDDTLICEYFTSSMDQPQPL